MRGNAYSERTTPFAISETMVYLKPRPKVEFTNKFNIWTFMLCNNKYAKNWEMRICNSSMNFSSGESICLLDIHEKREKYYFENNNEVLYTIGVDVYCRHNNLFLTAHQLTDASILIKNPASLFKYLEKLDFSFEEIANDGSI